MHVGSSNHAADRKRARSGEISAGRKSKQKRQNESNIEEHEQSRLLNLPRELLTHIFALSANDALPETCTYLYDALFANPKHNSALIGPPLWLQEQFVVNTNPTISFAVQKCLRRRFFGAETFKLFLPALLHANTMKNLSVPLRCITQSRNHTRELLLFAELFLNEVSLKSKSCNKALVNIAARETHVDCSALFWQATKDIHFSSSHIVQAFKCAVKLQSYDRPNGMFAHLVHRFGISEVVGHLLYDLAIDTQDSLLIRALQRHGIRPDMSALTKIMHMGVNQGESSR